MNHLDVGLDLERAKALPECAACRKKSDGAKRAADGTVLCGTHFDEFLATLFPKSEWFGKGLSPAAFAQRLRETRYAACWTATVATVNEAPVPPNVREPDYNAKYCPKCGEEVGMMGHCATPCRGQKRQK